MAEAYWQELMPHADVVQDVEQCAGYFQERFPFADPNHRVQWAMLMNSLSVLWLLRLTKRADRQGWKISM